MNHLFIDIETIPCQQPNSLMEIRKSIQHPGNMSKAETIAKWYEEKADAVAEEQWRKTAFDGAKGEIISIGLGHNDGPVVSLYRSLDQPESDLLKTAFAEMARVVPRTVANGLLLPCFTGHNIIGFGIRFLFQRAVILDVRPSLPLPVDRRYCGDRIFDTMLSWAGWGNYVSLATLCDALGIPVSEGLESSQVWDYVKAGRVQEVAACCEENVFAVREVYRRMTFAEVAA